MLEPEEVKSTPQVKGSDPYNKYLRFTDEKAKAAEINGNSRQ